MKFGSSIWHCKRINDLNDDNPEYGVPSQIILRPNYLSCVPATSKGYMAVMMYGEKLTDTWMMIASPSFNGDIQVGDLFWLDGSSPVEDIENMYGNGSSANAIVRDISEVNFTTSITLERNQNIVKQ
jgi:hypothetical protein